jgi:hypothetical protein
VAGDSPVIVSRTGINVLPGIAVRVPFAFHFPGFMNLGMPQGTQACRSSQNLNILEHLFLIGNY